MSSHLTPFADTTQESEAPAVLTTGPPGLSPFRELAEPLAEEEELHEQGGRGVRDARDR